MASFAAGHKLPQTVMATPDEFLEQKPLEFQVGIGRVISLVLRVPKERRRGGQNAAAERFGVVGVDGRLSFLPRLDLAL